MKKVKLNKKTIIALSASLGAVLIAACVIILIFALRGKDDDCNHDNTSLQNALAVSCANDGYTGDLVCNDCTKIVQAGTVIPKLEHTYGEGKITKQPTCISQGVISYTCSGCGEDRHTSIETVAHKDEYHDDQAGNHFHTCLTCTMNASETHTPVENSGKNYAASCTEDAYTEYTCSLCDGIYKVYDTTNKATGHKFSSWELTEATCMEEGHKSRTCSNEGCGLTESITIPVSANCDIVFIGYENNQAPDCIHSATALYACKDCHMPATNKTIDATGIHNYGTPTATGDGFVTKTCSVCYDTISSFDASTLTSATVTTDKINASEKLEMNMKEAAIQFPSDVVSEITSGTDLSVSAGVLDATAKNEAVNKVQDNDKKQALANAPIYDFNVQVDGTPFSQNFAAPVAITVPYTDPVDDAEGITIFYLANNGTIQEINNVVYNADNQTVSFFVEHFSFYAVAYQETQAMRCKRGVHLYEKVANGTVTATCYQFGYTDYECSYCHKHTVDDIQERTDHNYGAIIAAKPTCENGAWSTRVCQNDGCHSVLNVQFFGATGHTKDGVANCTTPSTCTKCNKILAHALGHSWTAWETIREATEVSTGLRRHYCTNCGIKEDVEIATTGTIEALKYDTYAEFIAVMLEEILNLSNGTLSFTATINGEEVVADIKVMKKDNGYRLSVVANAYDEDKVEFYYDNGVFVAIKDGQYGAASELDNLVPLTIDVYKEILEELYVQIDAYAAEYLALAKTTVEEYKGIYGEQINSILASAELPYTVDNINELFDSVETVYAYLSLKLGFTTAHQIKTDILVPTKDDIKAVLALFMESTENNGVTTYSLTAQPMLDFAQAVIDFYDEHSKDTLAQFIYFAIGEEAVAFDATLTSFNAIVDYVANKFPGTYKVSDAVNDYVTFAEETGFLTIDQLYEILDMVGAIYMQEGFSTKDLIDEFSDITLDDLACEMMGSEATMSDLYAMLKEAAANTVVGQLYYEGMQLDEIVAYFSSTLEALDIALNLSVSFDKNGNLIGIEFTQTTLADVGEDEPVEVSDIKLSIKRDDTTVVEIPTALKGTMADVNTYYDNNGNLVIEGLNPNADYNFSIEGSGTIGYKDALVKDEELSKVYGKDIYVLKEEYWSERNHLGDYIVLDGKYYASSYKGWCSIIEPESVMTFEELKTSIASRLENKKWSDGNIIGTETPVYEFRLTDYSADIGIAYKSGNTWMVATKYGYADNHDTECGYYVLDAMKLDDFVKTLKITMASDTNNNNYYYETQLVSYNGENYNVIYATISYGNNGETVTTRAFQRGTAVLFYDDYRYLRDAQIYDFSEEVTELPEYDYTYKYNRTVARYNEDGTIEFISATEVDLYKRIPTYYIKVADGIYTEFDSLNNEKEHNYYESLDTTGMGELKLPDGNTLYILGETDDNKYGYKNGYTTVYGYAKVVSGVYMQAAALVDEAGNIVDVLYRYAKEYADVNIRYVYPLDNYLSENNGVYTVSAELINKLKALCTTERTNFYIQIEGTETINGTEFDYMYMVGSYINMPEIDLDDIEGSFDSDNYEFWRNLFGNASGGNSKEYDVVKNDDGSITLIFPIGSTMDNVSFPSNTYFPADGLWVKNEELSASTGLNIYTCTRSYTSHYSTGSYVYKNGKYYNYSIEKDYKQTYTTDISTFTKNWKIDSTTWRFDMIGAAGLPEKLPVYETDIRYTYTYYNYGDDWWTSSTYMTLYTFFINGVMNVAVAAEVTGESLLTFEDYMPLSDYMNSLTAEVSEHNKDYYYYGSHTLNVNGVKTTVYSGYVYLYENYQGTETQKVSIPVYYVREGNNSKYITSRSLIKSMIKIGSEVSETDMDKSDTAERNQWTSSYSNGTVTLVSFNWQETNFDTVKFVKLAGRMYRYDNSGYYYWWNDVYTNARMYEWEFENQSLDKVWYYAVQNLETGEYTYYTEFVPSDYGFAPSGSIVNEWEIEGELYNETLLGYTADGCPLYEVAFYITPDDTADWTSEPQADGTVFLHRNGTGYLKVTEKNGTYYVRARKVQMADGTTEIYCFLRSGHLFGQEIGTFAGNALNGYVTLNGNTVTFSEEFLEVAKNNNRNEFYIYISGYTGNGYWRSYEFDYYQLESLFMLGNADGVDMGGNNDGVIEGPMVDFEGGNKNNNINGDNEDIKEDVENVVVPMN